MGIVALVLITVSLVWTAVFGGLQPSSPGAERTRTWYPWLAGGRVMSRIHAYQPPARKSVMVDITGMAHPTADGTSMTKRDRSRLYPFLEIKPATLDEEERSPAPPPAPPPVVGKTPLYQAQIEEAPLPSPGPALFRPVPALKNEVSLGRKVQLAVLADNSLSRSIRLTLRATSAKNKVTLRGIVLDKDEKAAVGSKAEQIAGAGNVDNRLTVL